MVLLMTEQMPKTPPKMPPAVGPSKIAPRITGMWTVVALVTTRGIIPRGVLASTTMMAANIATAAIQRVSLLRVFICNYLLLSLPALRRCNAKFWRRIVLSPTVYYIAAVLVLQ